MISNIYFHDIVVKEVRKIEPLTRKKLLYSIKKLQDYKKNNLFWNIKKPKKILMLPDGITLWSYKIDKNYRIIYTQKGNTLIILYLLERENHYDKDIADIVNRYNEVLKGVED